MQLSPGKRDLQQKENRPLRAGLTLIFVVGAMFLGLLAANWYNWLLTEEPYGWVDRFLAGGPPTDAGKVWAVIAFMVAGGLMGFLISNFVYRQILETQTTLENMSAREKTALFLGLVFGLILTFLITASFRMPPTLSIIIAIVLCYLSVAATMSIKEQLRFYNPMGAAEADEQESPRQQSKLLDTNVIIDGRILDVCRTGFVEGNILIPRFILDELQHIADSSDSLKRARGRRGLDILNQMRKELGMKVTTFDPDGIKLPSEVDSKLVTVAQHLEAAIITNDFNLNKVAELQGVTVLNINELANSLKPVVLPGEQMNVTVIREGKEPQQGVAYLDDGTMVVIENAKRLIGERVEVIVASVWQTVAGKMIFANLKEEAEEESSQQTASRSRRRQQQ